MMGWLTIEHRHKQRPKGSCSALHIVPTALQFCCMYQLQHTKHEIVYTFQTLLINISFLPQLCITCCSCIDSLLSLERILPLCMLTHPFPYSLKPCWSWQTLWMICAHSYPECTMNCIIVMHQMQTYCVLTHCVCTTMTWRNSTWQQVMTAAAWTWHQQNCKIWLRTQQ